LRVFSFDWATKKALRVYDSKTQKVKQISNSIEAFEKFLKGIRDPVAMLYEFGGGDTFKILAFRAGHTVLQVPGKKIRDYREEKGIQKSDSIDAQIIYDFFIENGGGSARISLKNISKKNMPSSFYLFQEADASIAEIKILFRNHEDLKMQMVREKNKKFAFELQFKIARVADSRIEKIKDQKDAAIAAKEKQLEDLKKILSEKIDQFPIWTGHYQHIKGIGSTIIAGLIGELGGRIFDSDESLKHYAGMVAKNDHHSFNRFVKATLFQFAEQVIKQRIPGWRSLYDSMKIFYSKKHPDWIKGKVNNHAKKFIETKFLIDFWQKWKEMDATAQMQ